MEVLRKIRTALAVIVGVPALICIASVLISEWLHGGSEVHVHAPFDSNITVSVDGEPPQTIAAGGHFEREYDQGEHRVTITSTHGVVEHALTLDNGLDDWLLPAHADQCWIEVDVFSAFYEDSTPDIFDDDQPTIDARYHADEAIEISSANYFALADLPAESGGGVRMMHEIPCATLDADDAQLLALAGYEVPHEE